MQVPKDGQVKQHKHLQRYPATLEAAQHLQRYPPTLEAAQHLQRYPASAKGNGLKEAKIPGQRSLRLHADAKAGSRHADGDNDENDDDDNDDDDGDARVLSQSDDKLATAGSCHAPSVGK